VLTHAEDDIPLNPLRLNSVNDDTHNAEENENILHIWNKLQRNLICPGNVLDYVNIDHAVLITGALTDDDIIASAVPKNHEDEEEDDDQIKILNVTIKEPPSIEVTGGLRYVYQIDYNGEYFDGYF